jgi:hypothetical protein
MMGIKGITGTGFVKRPTKAVRYVPDLHRIAKANKNEKWEK